MEGEGGAECPTCHQASNLAVDAAGIGNPSPRCCGCGKLEELLETQLCWHKGREKLLLDRITELHGEMMELRRQVSALMESMGERNLEKKKKKEKKLPKKSLIRGSTHVSVGGGSSPERSRTRTPDQPDVDARARVRDRDRAYLAVSNPSSRTTTGHMAIARAASNPPYHRRPATEQRTAFDEPASSASSDTENEDMDSATASDRGRRSQRTRTHTRRTSAGERDGNEISLPTDDEDLWQLVSSQKGTRRTKRRDIFIGNLLPSTTDERLTEYIHRRAKVTNRVVTLHFVSVSKEDKDHELLRARISINASDASLLLHRNFWPSNVYARPWRFKENQPASPTVSNNDKGALSEQQALKQAATLLENIKKHPKTPLPNEAGTPSRKRPRESPLADDDLPSTKTIVPSREEPVDRTDLTLPQ